MRRYFADRARLLGVTSLVAVLLVGLRTRAPSQDAAGVRQALKDATGLSVGAFSWEPSQGTVLDFLVGRPLLFEGARLEKDSSQGTSSDGATGNGATGDGAPGDGGQATAQRVGLRDIYRTFVRLSPDGKLLDVSGLWNLTRTPASDESQLQASDRAAAFASESPGAPPSLSLLDFQGEANPARRLHFLEHFQLRIARFLESGTTKGLGRTDIVGTTAEDALQVRLDGTTLHLDAQLAGQPAQKTWRLGTSPQLDDPRITVNFRRREPLPWAHFAANTGRRLVGKDWIAWAEGRFFSARDMIRRVGYSLSHPAEETKTPAKAPQKLPLSARSQPTTWPPEDLSSVGLEPGDGAWKAVKNELLPRTDQPFFFRTVLHTDPRRPYAELHLVAMDMRRLELGVGAGYEDPEPESGPPGSGQLPNDPQVFENVVATFNGAFKSTHGQYGIKTEGRVLVKPRVGAATVVVDREGRVGMGTWPPDESTRDLRFFRQNLDPLIASGKLNPTGRKVWGDHLYGTGVAVERSALCLHESGHLFYAWATEATGESLAQGLRVAGCQFAMHLDMNPGHCAFLFNRVDSVEPLKAKGRVLDPRMKVNATRFVRWSPKDFFYVTRHFGPSGDPSNTSFDFRPAPGQGPPPESVPAIYLGTQNLGGLELEVEKVDLGRFRFAVHPSLADGRDQEESRELGLTESQESQVLVTWGLGHATLGNQTGLTFGRHVLRPLRRTFSSLVLENGEVQLLPPSEPLAERTGRVVVQLPTLAREGELLPTTHELGGQRTRAALCMDNHGNMYVGRLTHDTIAPLVNELIGLGCELVVEMDRGSHSPILLEREGTEHSPHLGHDQTVLYALSKQMQPKTFEF